MRLSACLIVCLLVLPVRSCLSVWLPVSLFCSSACLLRLSASFGSSSQLSCLLCCCLSNIPIYIKRMSECDLVHPVGKGPGGDMRNGGFGEHDPQSPEARAAWWQWMQHTTKGGLKGGWMTPGQGASKGAGKKCRVEFWPSWPFETVGPLANQGIGPRTCRLSTPRNGCQVWWETHQGGDGNLWRWQAYPGFEDCRCCGAIGRIHDENPDHETSEDGCVSGQWVRQGDRPGRSGRSNAAGSVSAAGVSSARSTTMEGSRTLVKKSGKLRKGPL